MLQKKLHKSKVNVMKRKSEINPEKRLHLPISPDSFEGKIGPTIASSAPHFPSVAHAPKDAPNILIFLLDDVGFGQTSAFGGPVHTPCLEALARAGLRYTRFHTTAMCSPTRAALLTGRNHHAVSFGCIVEWATGFPGYNCMFPRSSATLADVLRMNGYATAALGKWHNTPDWETGPDGPFDRWPTNLGFEHFYGFMGADCDQFSPPLIRGTEPIEPPRSPQDGYILDEDLADQAIAWIRRQRVMQPERPFFLWYATGTAHSPLHAPKKWLDHYAGRFGDGWDKQRELTLARQKELGIVPPETVLTPRPEEIPAWDALSPATRKVSVKYQQAFAAAVSHCDYQIGRVITAIENLGERDNTLIVFLIGDNGPSAEGGLRGVFNKFANINGIPEDEEQNLARIDQIGGPNSYPNYPAGWGWAGSSPLRWFKQIASHLGGVRNGLILSWPKGEANGGGIRTQFHHCVDIAPTILAAAGIPQPKTVNGVVQSPFDGVSMQYSFSRADAKSTRERQYFEMIGNRALYEEEWMASARHGNLPWEYAGDSPTGFDTDRWELYNLEVDFSQARDLASSEPERLNKLRERWLAEAAANNVMPLDDRRAKRLMDARPATNNRFFRYFAGCVRIPEVLSPNVKGRSHRITCSVEHRAGDEGVLVAAGGRFGGYVLLIKDGCLTYAHNLCGTKLYKIRSARLAEGLQTLEFDFTVDRPVLGSGGIVRLSSNGSEIGGGRIEKTVPFRYSWGDTFNVGQDSGTPVTDEYAPPFKYTGDLQQVTVEVLSDLEPADRAEEGQTAERLLRENH